MFPEFSGVQFDTFISVAENLRSEHVFGHTRDGKLLPRGESSVKGPMGRLFKPFDELYADFQVYVLFLRVDMSSLLERSL